MAKFRNFVRKGLALLLTASLAVGNIATLSFYGGTDVVYAAESEIQTIEEVFPGLNHWYGEADNVCGGSNLSESEKLLYDQLVTAANDVMCGKYTDERGVVRVPLFQAPYLEKESLEKIYYVFSANYPMAFWLDGYTYSKSSTGYSMTFSIREEYGTYDAIKERWKELLDIINSYVEEASKLPDDFSKAKYLYKELVSDKEYAYDENRNPSEEKWAHNIEGPLTKNTAVCEGFAKTYALLLNICGIENHVATGWKKSSGLGHAWNLVLMDDKTYICDATWDVGEENSDNWHYFMIGTEKDDGEHVYLKENRLIIDDKYNNDTVTYVNHVTEKDYEGTEPVLGDLCTMTITYGEYSGSSCSDMTVMVYNNGLMVPIEDDKFEAYAGAILTVKAWKDAYRAKIEIDGKTYDHVYDDTSFTAEDSLTIKASYSTNMIETYGEPYDLVFSKDGSKATGFIDIILEDGRKLEKISAYYQSEGSLNEYIALEKYVDDSKYPAFKEGVWYDSPVNVYANVFENEFDYDGTIIDAPEGLADLGLPWSRLSLPGSKCSISLKQGDGIEIRAYIEENGELIRQKNQFAVPFGTKIILEAYTGTGEANVIYACSTNNAAQSSKMTGHIFAPVGDSVISAELIEDDVDIASVTDIAESYFVKNGTSATDILLNVLPQNTYITTVNGHKVRASIDWVNALDDYDASKKEAHELTVTGGVVLPDKISNGQNVSLDISTKLSVAAADNVALYENAIPVPESIIVANGTPVSEIESALPSVLMFVILDEDGETTDEVEYIKIDWEYDETNRQMVGSANSDGYTYQEKFTVDVVEKEQGVNKPVSYSIKYKENGNDITKIYPRKAVQYTGTLSIAIPPNQTDRQARIYIPRGFKDVSVFEAEYIDGVKETSVSTEDDGSSWITVKFDDSVNEGEIINIDFVFTTRFTAVRYGNAYDKYSDTQNDLGTNYPIGAELPIRLEYGATEDGSFGEVYLPLLGRLEITYAENENYINYGTQSLTQSINQSGKETYNISISKFLEIYDNAPYAVSVEKVTPLPDIVAVPSGNYTRVYKKGNTTGWSNRDGYVDSITIELKDGVPSGTYEADEIEYFICKDVWGNTYIYETGTANNWIKYKAKFRVVGQSDKLSVSVSGNKDYEAEFLIYPKGQAMSNKSDIAIYSLKGNGAPISCDDFTVTVDIPDGVFPTTIELYADDRRTPSNVIYTYLDGTTEEFTRDDFGGVYSGYDIDAVDSKFKNDDERLRSIAFLFDGAICNVNEGWYLKMGMQAYATYSDGTPVPAGSYCGYNPETYEFETDCPLVSANITVSANGDTATAEYGGYLISAGKTSLRDIYYRTDREHSETYSYADFLHPKDWSSGNFFGVHSFVEFSKDSLGADDMTNVKISYEVADILDVDYVRIWKEKYFPIDEQSDNYKIIYRYDDETTAGGTLYDLWRGKVKLPENKRIVGFDIILDDTAFITEKTWPLELNIIGKINFDLCLEQYGKVNTYADVISTTVTADQITKPVEESFCVRIKSVYDVTTGFSIDTSNYTTYNDVIYNNTEKNVVSVVSEVEQPDGAYVKWYLARGETGSPPRYSSDRYTRAVHVADVTARLTLDKTMELSLDDDIYYVANKINYDGDGDGTAEMVLQEEHKVFASNIKQVEPYVYDITFEDFYTINGGNIYIPIKPTVNTSQAMNPKLSIQDAHVEEDQPYIWQEYKDYMVMKYTANADTSKSRVNQVSVVTAWSEKVDAYGKSASNQSTKESVYNVETDETFTYTTHIFNEPEKSMKDMELIVTLPKNGVTIKSNTDNYTSAWDAELVNVTVPVDAAKNYQIFYTANGDSWEAFDGNAASVTDDISAIKITADEAFNGDEIVMTLKSADDTNAKGKVYIDTAFSYKDCVTEATKAGYSRVITYKIMPESELTFKADEIDFGTKPVGESVFDLKKQIIFKSTGKSDVTDIKISVKNTESEDISDIFEVSGKTLTEGTIPAIASGENAIIYVGPKEELPVGAYSSVVRVEWTDDGGSHIVDIPLIFTVAEEDEIVKYKVTYNMNSFDALGEVPVDETEYESGDKVNVLSGDGISRTDYIFVGWALKADAGADEVITEFYMDEEDVTLYAVWIEDKELDPTPDPNPDPTPDPNPDPTPNPNPTPNPDPTPNPNPTPDPNPNPNPTQTTKPEPVQTPDLPEKDESKETGNDIAKRTDLSILLVKGIYKSNTSIMLTWLEEKSATGYEIYWSYCGKTNYKKLKTVNASKPRKCIHEKLKKDRAYKYYVVSYKMVKGKKKYISKSPAIHVAMKNEKRTNAKSIKANKNNVTLALKSGKYKKIFSIKATVKKENSKKNLLNHANELRYYTSNKKVATVSSKGKITAKKKGTCTVYIIANNGVYAKIKVTVK